MNFGAALQNDDAGLSLNLPAARATLEAFRAAIESIEADARAVEVRDAETEEAATIIGGRGKKLSRAIESERKEILAPSQEFTRAVNALCKSLTDPLTAAEATLKGKISQYQARAELERRERERKAREAAEELQRKLDAEAKQKGVEAPTVPTPIVPEVKRPVRTEAGTSYQVRRWICEITDPEAVPREYCMPVQRLLDDAVKMGARAIPGCNIREITETRFRA